MDEGQMITEAEGNLLTAEVEALVNTVNTVGVMGKGIALQFKRAYPEMFKDYVAAAKRGSIHLGSMHVWATGTLSGPRYVINFPTKGHWKSGSRLKDVAAGLDDLVRVIGDLNIRSLALPPLGCGNGGLDWGVVRPLIMAKLADLPSVDVRIYAPVATPQAAEMPVGGPHPRMTPGRAAMISLIREYTKRAAGPPSLIEIQKLAYFLQEAGEPLRLNFVAHRYGPYADALRHTLQAMEGYFLQGFGDGSRNVQDAEPITLLSQAAVQADTLVAKRPDLRDRIDEVLNLVDGFESAYSLELLATVHWIRAHSSGENSSTAAAVAGWNRRKGALFTERHVEIAEDVLDSRGWSAHPTVLV